MKRTPKQRAALEVYFRELANTLNDAGYDMKKVFEVKVADVPWSQELVKEALWRNLQETMTGKHSTTDLETEEVSEVYEVLNRHISQNFGISVPFPSYFNEPDNNKQSDQGKT